jgi:selenoprotein W-related protein
MKQPKLSVTIEYCRICNFRGRAAWLAQELLTAHEEDLGGVTLVPGQGGIFQVGVDGDIVFSNREEGRLPEPRELKDAIRARLGLGPAPHHG